MDRYAKQAAWLIGAWFLFSLTASAFHLYQTGADQPPLFLGLAAVTPIAAFLAWFALSPRFRQFTLSLSPRALTIVQTWRVGGLTFLVLAGFRILPYLFALPAGLGDFAVGLTAPLVAMKMADSNHKKSFIRWQLFGMLDLVTAVTIAALAHTIDPNGVSTAPMTLLPLSLIPTFAVPLFFILQFICIAQARRWPAQRQTRVGDPAMQAAQQS